VAGFIETHGRAETAGQIGDLEVIPRRRVSYQGVAVEEMDVDAILARKPQIALVDELAHTNAPGSPRAKRYEDVEVLRDAGIDVIATMNVQHLESLRDVIVGITGVEVRETVPDRILDDAEVQLIDLPTEALIDRLAEGKVYPPQRAQQALAHYFRAGNLTALRELALRHTAAGVDEQLEQYMRDHTIEAPWPATERMIVVLDADPSAAMVLRSAWRLASAMHGELLAVAVLPPGGWAALPSAERHDLERNLRLAEDLGATTKVIEGEVVASTLAQVVRAEHATTVVLAHTPQQGWRRFFRESLPDQLLRLLEGVDLHLVETRPDPH
ncbi:MAG TPA: universal stress protein, partial [Thermomicrobiales bacterium]|nr:universal stress protein [Thermomicrobiales bacterium]